MDDLLSEFLTEANENLAELDVELVHLEQNPNDKDILSNIFRMVHTIKGTCGFLGLPRLEKLAHSGENVMDKFRSGELEVRPTSVTLILNAIDRIKEILAYLEQYETEPEGDDSDLINKLNLTAEGKDVETTSSDDTENGDVPLSDEGFPVAAELLEEVEEAIASGNKAASPEEIAQEMEKEREKESEPSEPKAVNKQPLVAVKENKKVEPAPAKEDAPKAKESSLAEQSIRVNVDLLENMMTLVSELVLTRNQLLQMVRGQTDSEFVSPLQRLSLITSDLQEGVMKTRMQPIGIAWNKLPRIVRDLATETGKKIDLQMYGAETELDRQVLELIRDPLTHMVRNSADHGLEHPDERARTGKSETGIIKLDAYHEGGHIIIEISDDGKGLNINRIKEKALDNGLVTESQLELMNEQQIAQFIFNAGFSTAEKVTSVSGRGVGMDVVKTNIEKIGGNIELKTKEGKGTSFRIKIPLTLAIVSALIVKSGGEKFAFPQISVVELVRVTKKSEQQIEKINNSAVLRLRDHLLPLVNLKEVLRLNGQEKQPHDDSQDEIFVIVSQVGTFTFGIIVDHVFDTEEIVVKPVSQILRDITMFSGNTILGDGSVIMILDPNGIATAVGETVESSSDNDEKQKSAVVSDDIVSFLIFKSEGKDPKAVPLALVARLEEFDVSLFEHSYGKPVVQYRGKLMPIVSFAGEFRLKEKGRQPVLVFADNERSMGLMVDEIVDIVEDKMKVELKADKEGIIGTAVIKGKATDVIDIGYYLTKAFGDWFGAGKEGVKSLTYGKKILVIDDSDFFLNLIRPLISAQGYEVTSVSNPVDALQMREKGAMFDAIVSDIEMPKMNGFEFAKEVKNDGAWKNIPLIALSSHATKADFEKGRDAGFDDYVVKFDRQAVLKSLEDIFEDVKEPVIEGE
ncbi:MAG: chemotaxis protein CheW [Alphaproteobacteria bacterium]